MTISIKAHATSTVFGVLLSLTLISLSCKKFVEVPLPEGELLSQAVFKDSSGSNSAVLGMYIDIMQNFALTAFNGGISIYAGLSSDEIYTTLSATSSNRAIQEFFYNEIQPENSANLSLWSSAYRTIYLANACIEGLNESTGISSSFKNTLIAECKFIRAFAYFHLVNLYGPVPLVISTDYHSNKKLPREKVDRVYQQIVADLIDAKLGLPQEFPTQDKIRPCASAAAALLARVYLFQGQWSNAKMEATYVIESGKYTLETAINNVFSGNSNETIWQLPVVLTTRATLEGFNFIPRSTSTAKPNFPISDDLVSSFEAGDLRRTEGHWIRNKAVAGVTYHYPYKYKTTTPSTQIPENYIVLRLAEQYLIRAEAAAQLNELSEGDKDLNLIRNRANLAKLFSRDKNELLASIYKERRLELFCEWANRWYDLKRTSSANSELSQVKTNWSDHDIYYPIPAVEIDKNPYLVQNRGY